MEVYIEFAILDNLIMDYILLKETAVLLKISYNKWRILIATIIGTIGAVCFPLLKMKSQYEFLLKIVLGMLMGLIAIKHTTLKGYLKYFNVFLLLTFVVGGAILGVFYLMGINTVNGYYGTDILPVGINLLAGYLLTLIVKKIIKKTVNRLIIDKFVYNCVIKQGGVTAKVKGYYDSGNVLIDKKTGLPIVLCDIKTINRMKNKGAEFSKPRLMEYQTVSSTDDIWLYNVDCLLINYGDQNLKRNVVLGVAKQKSFTEDLLLSAYVL